MSKILHEGEINFKELLAFAGVIVFIIGAILFYKNDDYSTMIIPGNNVVWAEFYDNRMEIKIKNTENVYGVQFEFDDIIFNDINNNGFLKENGFEISHNEKVILSFSFQGTFIPIGEHNLVSINLTYPKDRKDVDIKNLVIAGEGGKSLDFSYYDTQKKIATFKTN